MAEKIVTVNVIHDSQRKILEILSLLRVMNNYYKKKKEIQKKIKPLVLYKFKKSLKELEKSVDWLFSVPNALNSLNLEFIKKNSDAFRFPDAIILFEAWMNLGMDAVFPRVAFNFDFPGVLPGEKKRSVFQFIYNFSRGFGFPISFNPEFFDYDTGFLKYFEPFLKWGHTIFHKANQAASGIDMRLNLNRHHPGEFESVIISEYEDGFKGIDTLLHGFRVKDPKILGEYESLGQALENVMFTYSVGDHAMRVFALDSQEIKKIPLIDNDHIKKKYEVDFYPYIQKLISTNNVITRRIKDLKSEINTILKSSSILDKIRYRIYIKQGKLIPLSQNLRKLNNIQLIIKILNKIRNKLWTTPIFSHTVHSPLKYKELEMFKQEDLDELDQEESESILLATLKKYRKKHNIELNEPQIVKKLEELRDAMASLWLYFRERYLNFAKRKMLKITSMSIKDPDYRKKTLELVDELMPIITIHEIFIRPLSDSVYPESIPQSQKMWTYLARFLTSKYNPIGFNLMKIFNRISYSRWSYYFKKKGIKYQDYLNFFLKMPIWGNIPKNVMDLMKNLDKKGINEKKQVKTSIKDKIFKIVEKF